MAFKRIGIMTLVLGLTMAAGQGYALTINDPGVVGAIESGTQNSSVDNEIAWANYLLSLGANAAVTADAPDDTQAATENYTTGSTDYNATLTGGVQLGGTDASGYEYVLAKYDGQNAGYVLFNVAAWFAANNDYNIPSTSETIWSNKKGEGYAISHFTGFGSASVPDGGASLVLLGAALSGLGVARRLMRK
jgi:hypothetical protein